MDENENPIIPDFSPDEFDNDKEIMKWREQERAFAEHMNDCIKMVSGPFNANKSSHKNLKGFELHRLIDTPFIMESYAGNLERKTVFFSVIQYHTSVRAARMSSSGTDNYLVGVITLDRSYPHTIIQQETPALKIHNLFVPGDVDFKHATSFSFRFHVITKDEDRLKRLFENIDLNKLSKFGNAEIEIRDNQCYYRASRKSVSREEAEDFIELTKTLCEIL